MFRPLSIFIGTRYTRAKRRNRFVSFISMTSMIGLALGVPVVDGVTAAVTIAESLVRLGLSTSKIRTYATPRAKKVLGWPIKFGH